MLLPGIQQNILWQDLGWLLMIALLRIIQCIEKKVRKDLRYCSTFRNLQGTAKRVFFESPVEHLQKDWESTIKLQHPVELCRTWTFTPWNPSGPIFSGLSCVGSFPPQWIESRILFMWFLVLHVPCSKLAKKQKKTTQQNLNWTSSVGHSFTQKWLRTSSGDTNPPFWMKKQSSSQQKEPQSSFKKLSQIS